MISANLIDAGLETPPVRRKKKKAKPQGRREPASLGYDIPKSGGILRVPCGGGFRVIRRGPSYDGGHDD
jgi:hypothetical protein